MASYHLSVKAISRSKGYSATAAAAYRAREAIYDERTGVTHDYSRMKNRALFTGIFAPKDAPEWAHHDREKLWNAAEKAETDFNRKKNAARVAQDIVVALPHEMTDQQRQWLMTDFVREQFTRKGYVADVAIHEPHEHGDARNYHAHILISERVITRDGFAPEKDRALKDVHLVDKWREDFARLTNRHLERHGHEARIDHRSLKEQGIEREPGLHMGKDATAAARKGRTTERGDRQRAIRTRNRTVEELLRELAELQQQQGIAGQFKENGMGLVDRLFHTFESLAAAPFGFIFGNDQSPEQYYRDPDKANTTEINIRTDAVNIQPYAPAAEQARDMKAAEPAPEQAQEMKQAEPTPEAPTPQTALQEQIAREKAWYAAQEQEQGQEREQEYTR